MLDDGHVVHEPLIARPTLTPSSLTTMSDIDDFMADLSDSINIPDESFEEYVARMAVVMNRCGYNSYCARQDSYLMLFHIQRF